jgi:hypothetical protein
MFVRVVTGHDSKLFAMMESGLRGFKPKKERL